VSDFPAVPLTVEGSAVLHQFFRFDWKSWHACTAGERKKIAEGTVAALKAMEHAKAEDGAVETALFSQLGHKGDLIFLHFRPDFSALNQVELELAQTPLADFLTPVHSYVSVVELGLYESSRKTWQAAADKGLTAGTAEFEADVADSLERAKAAMAPRLYPAVPEAKYFCFYPMDRRRGEEKNWYTTPFAERQSMMHAHGMVGRKYADKIKQIITGSIGLDDWEWGVTLFSEDPIEFKKIIYEMRFDEVSAVYGEFGQFFLGLRLGFDALPDWLEGRLA
jgi:chlorite dismutase